MRTRQRKKKARGSTGKQGGYQKKRGRHENPQSAAARARIAKRQKQARKPM